MAQSTRAERQLMRQRGAGSREVRDISFGLDFDAQDSRENRQLMRQRGAGYVDEFQSSSSTDEQSNRNIDKINFDFSIPTPRDSRRSSRRKSQSVPGSTESQRSRRERSLQTPQPVNEPERPNSGKRRRLAGPKTVLGLVENGSNARLSKQRRTTDPVSIIEHKIQQRYATSDHGTEPAETGAYTPAYRSYSSPPLFVPQSDGKENRYALPIADPKPLPENSHSKRLRSSVSKAAHSHDEDELEGSVVNSIEQQQDLSDLPTITETLEHIQEADDASVLSVTQPSTLKPIKKRKKRKSVVLGRKRRRSSDIPQLNTSQVRNNQPTSARNSSIDQASVDGENLQTEDKSLQDGSEDNAEPSLLQDRSAHPVRFQGRRNRLSVSTSPAPGEPAEDGDETYVEDEASPEPATPAPNRKQKQSRVRRQSHAKRQGTRTEKQSRQKSFPISVHRMTNRSALPTIIEISEEEGIESDSNTRVTHRAIPDRAQFNSVDVLAQNCHEKIQDAIDNLAQGTSGNASRAEVKRKRTALEAFGKHLEQQLVDMSIAVEDRMNLEARLRESKRTMTSLQTRWVEVRRQRDDLALRADAVRRQNWELEEEGKRRGEISELAHRTELNLRAQVSEKDDLEFLIRKVSHKASSASNHTGTLKRIQLFNQQLERLAVFLESR